MQRRRPRRIQAAIDRLTSDNLSLRVRLEGEISKTLQRRKHEETLLDLVRPHPDDEESANDYELASASLAERGPSWLGAAAGRTRSAGGDGSASLAHLQPATAPASARAAAAAARSSAGKVDYLTLRVLNILRRYSLARIVLLVYLAVLHLWTLAVLNTCLVE
eukprot:Unigene9343_Nuclearia_a/m.28514 Unigene9343_Nuclearia_a/g.28514  ORF Unigene9343_Nuclearia_a/g.28514 Unigene9343_Nuclearia_a/m.28514 type:complete len:163 (-) Unigene9343_Nuclearia_a:12-500(-)